MAFDALSCYVHSLQKQVWFGLVALKKSLGINTRETIMKNITVTSKGDVIEELRLKVNPIENKYMDELENRESEDDAILNYTEYKNSNITTNVKVGRLR